MSAINGTDTNFSSIQDIHDVLNFPGSSEYEFEFLSGSTGKPMIRWGQLIDNVLFNKPIVRPQEALKSITSSLNKQLNSDRLDSLNRNVTFTIYDALCLYPEISKFKQLVDYVGYGKLKETNGKITLLAPVNKHFDEYFWYLFNVSYTKTESVEALRYHILPYLLLPQQIKHRKLRLRTDMEHRQLEADWTNNKQQFINPLSYSESPHDWFPKKSWEVNCIGTIVCDNGIIYIIDRPLYYPEGTTGNN